MIIKGDGEKHSSALLAFCSPGLGNGKPSLLGQVLRAADLTWQLSETMMLKLRSGNEIPLTASFPAEPLLFFFFFFSLFTFSHQC